MMVYILKSLVKISLAWILLSNLSYADIVVDEQNLDSTKIKYFLDYELDNDLKKIIDKGISIQILETIIVKRKNKYFFDNVVFKRTKKFKIEYHPLIKKFYFFEESEKFSFAQLNELVRFINKPRFLILENTKDPKIKNSQ